jgi:uncharacterized membrane-anchored protein YitT (DUF2179 family)
MTTDNVFVIICISVVYKNIMNYCYKLCKDKIPSDFVHIVYENLKARKPDSLEIQT